MILHLSGDVDYEMFNNLTKSFNMLKDEERLYIYFTCPQGGMTDVGEALVDFVNKNKDSIDIFFYGELFSTGMIIFLATDCQKEILKDTRGMYHFAWQEININQTGKPTEDYDIFSMKEMKRSKAQTIEFLKNTKLSDKELTLIKKGKDVYFSYDRMRELI